MSPKDESGWGLDNIPLPKRVRGGVKSLERSYSGSSAEHLWNRLNAMDFINKGMLFAAVLLLCFFPFIIVANALAGQSAVTGLVRHLGLNQEAAQRRQRALRVILGDFQCGDRHRLPVLHSWGNRGSKRSARPL